VTAVDSAGNESAYSNEVNGAPHSPLGVDEILAQIPKEYSLFQNYPNPFNPSTTIRYGLPSRSSVRLVVINVLGQTVGELVNSEQEAGYQSIVWNAEVSSGVYIYRVTAISLSDPTKHFVDTKKMLLMK
jgi:hypothetical protein